MKIIPSPMCSCGEAEQDTAHILQSCKNHRALREEIWPKEGQIIQWPKEGQTIQWPKEGQIIQWPKEGQIIQWPKGQTI
jgi:hypothetical protein